MDFHLITIIITYIFLLLIVHIMLKNNELNSQIYSEYNDLENELEYVEPKESVEITQLKENKEENRNDNLVQINDYDEDNARNELLNYLDSENKNLNKERDNILQKYTKNNIVGSNTFNNQSTNHFENENLDTSKFFTKETKENFSDINSNELKKKTSFDVNKNSLNLSKEKQTIFDNVQAFDDFDDAYASFEKI